MIPTAPASELDPADILELAVVRLRQGKISEAAFLIRFTLSRLGKRATAAAPEELGSGILDALFPCTRGLYLSFYERNKRTALLDGLTDKEAGEVAARQVADDNGFFLLDPEIYERAIFNRDWWTAYLIGIVGVNGLQNLTERSHDPQEIILEELIEAAVAAGPHH